MGTVDTDEMARRFADRLNIDLEQKAGERVDRVFTYHRPHGDQAARYEAIRGAARSFAHLILDACPAGGSERGIALDKLREVVMWANAGIACNELPEAEPVDFEGETQPETPPWADEVHLVDGLELLAARAETTPVVWHQGLWFEVAEVLMISDGGTSLKLTEDVGSPGIRLERDCRIWATKHLPVLPAVSVTRDAWDGEQPHEAARLMPGGEMVVGQWLTDPGFGEQRVSSIQAVSGSLVRRVRVEYESPCRPLDLLTSDRVWVSDWAAGTRDWRGRPQPGHAPAEVELVPAMMVERGEFVYANMADGSVDWAQVFEVHVARTGPGERTLLLEDGDVEVTVRNSSPVWRAK